MSNNTQRPSPFDLRPRHQPVVISFSWVFPYAPIPIGRPLPVLRCWLELPGVGPRELAMAVDTGADVSLVDGAFALARGFDPTAHAERLEPLRGVTGAGIAYVHSVPCILGPANDPRRFTLDVAFTDPTSPPPPLNVLGRRGFLDRFDLAIRTSLLPPTMYLEPRIP